MQYNNLRVIPFFITVNLLLHPPVYIYIFNMQIGRVDEVNSRLFEYKWIVSTNILDSTARSALEKMEFLCYKR